MGQRKRFDELLRAASSELYEDNPSTMRSGHLLPTTNALDTGDVELFFAAVDAGLVTVERGGKFNTLDRPKPGGRWSLLSRGAEGGWYNAEYLPQIAAYAELILRLGYPYQRVLFELPSQSLQLDVAVLDDTGRVVVLGEAKRDTRMLDKLRQACLDRFGDACPDDDTKKRGDEARQLAWRLWTVAPDYMWLIAPGERPAYRTELNPLRLESVDELPTARDLDLDHAPPAPISPPDLRTSGTEAIGKRS